MTRPEKTKVMVLAGGPDRERPVSLISGEQVAKALDERGHDVRLRDILPDNLAALDEFEAWQGDAIFPAMHGSWGEGGGLQKILEARHLPFLGCGSEAADLCMDKYRTKQVLKHHGLPTASFELLQPGVIPTLKPPLVLKPLREGSSIDIAICKTPKAVVEALRHLEPKYDAIMAEAFIDGLELTVGVLGKLGVGAGVEALPPVQIIPATEFYDYEAKYTRDDTQYVFDIPLASDVMKTIRQHAMDAHRVLGCLHLSRVDFMVDRHHKPFILEINTIPGFTTHSLVPKAAAHAGIEWHNLVERLTRLAAERPR